MRLRCLLDDLVREKRVGTVDLCLSSRRSSKVRFELLPACHPLGIVRAAILTGRLWLPFSVVRGRQVEKRPAVQLAGTPRHRGRDNRVPAVGAHQRLHRVELGIHVGDKAAVVTHSSSVLLHQLRWKEHPGNSLCQVIVLGAFAGCPLGGKRLWLLQLGLLIQRLSVEVHDRLRDRRALRLISKNQ